MDVLKDLAMKIRANGGFVKSEEPQCKICKDRGFLMFQDEDGYTSSKDCICKRKKRWYGLIKREGLFERYQKNNFDNFDVDSESSKRAKDQAMAYVKDYQNKSLIITGAVGSGKTHLAMAVASSIAESEFETNSIKQTLPKIVFYNSLINKLKSSKRFSSDYETITILDEYKNTEFLVIDDFLKIERTAEVVTWMFEIINARYNQKLPTIITSELTPKQIVQIDEALGSRLIEMAGGVSQDSNIIILSDKNRRLG